MAKILCKGYTFDPETMKSSTCGTIGSASKDGKKFFCKQFNNPVEPVDNGALSPRAIARNREQFEEFRRRKTRLNRTLRDISGLGGNIVCPMDEAVCDHHWTEFSEYVEGALPEKEYAAVIGKLDEAEKILVLKIAMGALQTIHGQKIVHGDLKLTNIMLVRNDSGHYVSKIIDFDGAFFEDDVPLDSITGTVDYYSPELALYSANEDPEIRAKLSKRMTTKSDIFTMGLILHEYLTGEKPRPDHLTASLQKLRDAGKFIYPWQVLLSRDKGEDPPQLVVSGRIREPALVALISDMLCLDPACRPTAAEVLNRLNSRALPMEEVWPEDALTLKKEAIRKKLVAFRRREWTGEGGVPVRGYEVVERDGRRFTKTAEELVRCGLASEEDSWLDPRPEDGVEWDLEQLRRAFVSIRPGDAPGIYLLADRRGNVRKIPLALLRMMGLANPRKGGKSHPPVKPLPDPGPRPPLPGPEPPTPSGRMLWPEDAAAFQVSEEAMARYRMEFLGMAEEGGVKGYRFQMANGTVQFLPRPKCQLMRFLVSR